MGISDFNLLLKQFKENTNSHIFLIDTNNIDDTLVDIKSLIKKIIDANDVVSNQIDNDTYLEIIFVEPDGKEIKKDQIKQLQERLKKKPILSPYLFYIIKNAQELSLLSSNKLLKTIEEPFENVVGFLLSTNMDVILPTIRSRCELIKIRHNKNEHFISENHDIIADIIECIIKKDILKFHTVKSNLDSESELKVIELLRKYYSMSSGIVSYGNLDECLIKKIKESNSTKSLIKKALYLNKVINKNSITMNSSLFLEKIFLELEDLS